MNTIVSCGFPFSFKSPSEYITITNKKMLEIV